MRAEAEELDFVRLQLREGKKHEVIIEVGVRVRDRAEGLGCC